MADTINNPATQQPTDNDATTAVDATPISALERRDSLEKHLQNRPDEQDLKDRHILLESSAAPALQAKAAELERQRVRDDLKKVSELGLFLGGV